MRGVILAGGTGSRLGSLTKAVNKHLLPVGGRPMVEWPLQVLRDNGIDDVTIVSSPEGVGQLAKLLGSGYTYRVQDRPGGTADALLCAESKSQEDVVVILGDNVFHPSPGIPCLTSPARVYLARVADPRQFGVAKFGPLGLQGVVEKPEVPPSDQVVTGLYVYSSRVFARLRDGPLSEYWVTEDLDTLAREGNLSSDGLPGFWGDAGTLEGIARCEEALR